MALLGDVSSAAVKRMLERLQGRGGFAERDSYREAELTGIAHAFEPAFAALVEAVEQHFPGLASSMLYEWETWLRLGNVPGRTDPERRSRLRLFMRLLPQLTGERVTHALRSLGTASLYRVEDEVAEDYHSNALSSYLVGIDVAPGSAQEAVAIKEAGLRAVPPGSWPVHLGGTDLLYDDVGWVEGQRSLTRQVVGTEYVAGDYPRMQYGPQFFPGMSELAEPLDDLFRAQWQSSGVSMVDNEGGYILAVSGYVEGSSVLELDGGSTISSGWSNRYLHIAGLYDASTDVWNDASFGLPRCSAIGAASSTARQLYEDDLSTTGLQYSVSGGVLRLHNNNATRRYFALFVRATPPLSADASATLVKPNFIRSDKATTKTMANMLGSLRQDARVWYSDRHGTTDANGSIHSPVASTAGGVRRFGLLLNMRRPASGATEYVVDSSVDWRDRFLCVVYGFTHSAAHSGQTDNPTSHSPHMVVSGETIAGGITPDFSYSPNRFHNSRLGAPALILTRDGSGSGDQVILHGNYGGGEVARLYARASDGALCVSIEDTGAYATASLTMLIYATGDIGNFPNYSDDGLPISGSNPVEAHRLARINDTFTMVQAHERVPTDVTEIEDDQNMPTWSRRSKCAPLGPRTRGSARVPGFEPRRLRLGDGRDSEFLFRQNLYGEVVRVLDVVLPAGTEVELMNPYDELGTDVYEHRGDQIDWRDRIVYLAGSFGSTDKRFPSTAFGDAPPTLLTFYTGIHDTAPPELERNFGTYSNVQVVLRFGRRPHYGVLSMRNANDGTTRYFSGTIWASPQLGFMDTRR